MGQMTGLLDKADIFKSCDPTIKEKLEKIAEKRVMCEGEDLAIEGREALFFFLLISGRIMVSTKEGKAVVLQNPGDFAGFELFSTQEKYISSVKSIKEGEAFFINRHKFIEVIQEDPLMAEDFMQEWEAYISSTAPFLDSLDGSGVKSIN